MIEGFEAKGFELPDTQAGLNLEASPKKGVSLQLTAKEPQLSYSQEILELTHQRVRTELLQNAFAGYEPQQDWIATGFDQNQLTFSRKLRIEKPLLEGQVFEALSLPEVAHQPAT